MPYKLQTKDKVVYFPRNTAAVVARKHLDEFDGAFPHETERLPEGKEYGIVYDRHRDQPVAHPKREYPSLADAQRDKPTS